MSLLEVRDLATEFQTREGILRAVNGVSFSPTTTRVGTAIPGRSGRESPRAMIAFCWRT